MMGREITIEQLRQDVGLMIEKITHVTMMFRQIKLTMEEYVCLKVITMLNQGKENLFSKFNQCKSNTIIAQPIFLMESCMKSIFVLRSSTTNYNVQI